LAAKFGFAGPLLVPLPPKAWWQLAAASLQDRLDLAGKHGFRKLRRRGAQRRPVVGVVEIGPPMSIHSVMIRFSGAVKGLASAA